jgi:hypothetical protein
MFLSPWEAARTNERKENAAWASAFWRFHTQACFTLACTIIGFSMPMSTLYAKTTSSEGGKNFRESIVCMEKQTTPQDIGAQGTQQRIKVTMKLQPLHMQMALQLFQQLQQWNYKLNGGMDVLQWGRTQHQDMEGGRHAKAELKQFMNEHVFEKRDVHNLLAHKLPGMLRPMPKRPDPLPETCPKIWNDESRQDVWSSSRGNWRFRQGVGCGLWVWHLGALSKKGRSFRTTDCWQLAA